MSHFAAEGVDPATVGITPEIISTDPVCPSPMPFLRNTNSSTAVLRGDEINGTQPEHAGVYTCYSNGQPQESVEIVVLGINYSILLNIRTCIMIHFIDYSSFGGIICF